MVYIVYSGYTTTNLYPAVYITANNKHWLMCFIGKQHPDWTVNRWLNIKMAAAFIVTSTHPWISSQHLKIRATAEKYHPSPNRNIHNQMQQLHHTDLYIPCCICHCEADYPVSLSILSISNDKSTVCLGVLDIVTRQKQHKQDLSNKLLHVQIRRPHID